MTGQTERNNLSQRIEKELLGDDGVVRRLRLRRGLALAYAGNSREGLLTLSRPYPKQPSEDEMRIVRRDVDDALTSKWGVQILVFKILIREEVGWGDGRHCVVRVRVAFGKQERLL